MRLEKNVTYRICYEISIIIILCVCVNKVYSHGRLIEPPSRASAWRYGFNTPPNYNDHELYCGGFTRQWHRNGGKCGVCGDAWDAPTPRANEYGGRYGQGVIVRHYEVGATITIRVEITANHQGFFEFRVCPDFKNTTQECLDKYVLQLAKPQENVTENPTKYYPIDGNRIYEMRYVLPNISCDHCVLQWKYIAGNNWGTCPDGGEAVGCGPQEEFRACADIQIGGKSEIPVRPTMPPRRPVFPRTSTSKPSTKTTTEEISSSTEKTSITTESRDTLWIAFIIILTTFFSVIILVSALYLYYYHGKTFKNWLKSKTKSKPTSSSIEPVKPPRTKKLQRQLSNLNSNLTESLA